MVDVSLSSDPQTVSVSLSSQTVSVSVAVGGVRKFISLSDTPTTYTGASGKIVRVKPTEDGVEFVDEGDLDDKVKVSSNDTTPGFLEDKVVATSNKITLVTNNEGVNETFGIDVAESNLTLTASQISDFDTEVSNNTDVTANTTHRTSDGSDHTFINQSVTTASSPSFTGLYVTRQGTNNEALNISVDDNSVILESLQDETANGRFYFKSSESDVADIAYRFEVDSNGTPLDALRIYGDGTAIYGGDFSIQGNFDLDGGDIIDANNVNILGDLTVDTNTLFVDSANDRVGVGTLTPQFGFHQYTTGSARHTIQSASSTGFIRLGLSTSTSIDSEEVGARIEVSRTNTDANGSSELSLWTSNGATMYERLTIKHDGNVGIGTTSPDDTLDVNGTAIINNMRITEASNINYIQSGDTRTGSSWRELRFSPYLSSNWSLRIDSNQHVEVANNLILDGVLVNNQTGANYIKFNTNYTTGVIAGNFQTKAADGTTDLSRLVITGGSDTTNIEIHNSSLNVIDENIIFETNNKGINFTNTSNTTDGAIYLDTSNDMHYEAGAGNRHIFYDNNSINSLFRIGLTNRSYSDLSLESNYLREAKIWYDLYDSQFRPQLVMPAYGDTLYYSVERGATVSATTAPASGTYANLFNLSNSQTRWDNVSTNQPSLTIDWGSDRYIEVISIVHAWRDSQLTDATIEVYEDNNDDGTYQWTTIETITGNTEYIVTARFGGWRVQRIRITVTAAGVGDQADKWNVGTIQATSAPSGKGTGHLAELGANTFYGAQSIQSVDSSVDTLVINASSQTTGEGLVLYSNSVGRTGTVLRVQEDNSGSTGILAHFLNDGTGIGLSIGQNGNGIALNIDSEATSQPLINLLPINTNTRGDIAFGTVRTSDPSSPSEGDMWYNSTDHQWKGYNGTSIVVLG